ncbi:MAG: hypothetical protein KGI75_12320 [Rhizobiaceae bacterium]|nr:hypothetical protein [Rhizobiaceae bacterium]
MGKILTFPKQPIAPISVRNGPKHRITVEVLDEVRPRRTRWSVQFEIQEASGFAALDGFTDAAVAAGYRHRFRVGTTRAVRQFVAETSDLVASGRIAVWIDGVRVQPAIKRLA